MAWDKICRPKNMGGLGILDLEIMNIALLSKWLWKLFNEKGLWQRILWEKYIEKNTFGGVQKNKGIRTSGKEC